MIVGIIIIGTGGSPLSIILCSFYGQRGWCVNGSSESSGLHYFASDRIIAAPWESSSRLDVLPDFSSISLHNLLCATSDGFRSYVSWFLLLGLPIVHFVLLGVIFCLDFGPFFFLLLFPCQVFFLSKCFSFIYLFYN
jgi:hypothetical protein